MVTDFDMKNDIDITEIINQEAIITFFQPIISLRQKAIIGLEALSRGINPVTGRIIAPNILFKQAESEGVLVELDRLCREKALTAFKNLACNQELFLSLNFKTSIIDKGVVGSGYLLDQVRRNDLNPGNIMIEIVESEVKNLPALADFVQSYKEHGFLIALDDFGAGYSNLDRVAVIKPDVIKIDRSLLDYIDREYYKQALVKSLILLSHKLGALALAEGIERTAEAISALELGADMFQGYYFARPVPAGEVNLGDAQRVIREIAPLLKRVVIERATGQKLRNEQYSALVADFLTGLAGVALENFDERLSRLTGNREGLECVYILDATGVQVSKTIFNDPNLSGHKRKFFVPAQKGADQSLKEYFLPLQIGLSEYITEPYVSAASGNACVTISTLFTGVHNLRYVLCLDVRV
jgi:EAL domain-containing protein (putative c-di-GMP-specific phosphodiesterase class I)